MTIINNRSKIQSEVPSQKYKDNWDTIFGQKKCTTFLTDDKNEDPNPLGLKEEQNKNQDS